MYVGKLPDGTVYGTWTSKQPDDSFHPGVIELPDDHPDILAFKNRVRVVVDEQTKLTAIETRLAALEGKQNGVDTTVLS